jgi:hypothetical protein
MILVVRMMFKIDASDDDKKVRVSTGTVRLVEPVGNPADNKWRQYFPLGTVEDGRLLLVNKPDDFLFLQGDKAADFLFVVDKPPASSANAAQIAPGSGMFIEAKRYGRVDLGGKTIEPLAASDKVEVLRKPSVIKMAPVDPEQGKKRLIGTWAPETSTIVKYVYAANGTMQRINIIGGQPVVNAGTWKVIESTNEGCTVEETINGKANKVKMTFASDKSMTRFDPGPVQMLRQ